MSASAENADSTLRIANNGQSNILKSLLKTMQPRAVPDPQLDLPILPGDFFAPQQEEEG